MHANETLLRNAYRAFAEGDIPGFLALCTPDMMLHVPGDGLLAGHHTMEAFMAKLGPAMEAVSGTFEEEVTRIAVTDEYGAVLVHQHAKRDGRDHHWNATHWWRIQGGKLADFHEFIDDPAAFDRAWHR